MVSPLLNKHCDLLNNTNTFTCYGALTITCNQFVRVKAILFNQINNRKMVQVATLIAALLTGSACAFSPLANNGRTTLSLNGAEKSAALPFLNRPALVSLSF